MLFSENPPVEEEEEQLLQPGRVQKGSESQCCWNGVQVSAMADSQWCGALGGGRNPKALEQLLSLTVDLRRAGEGQPCPSSLPLPPYIFSDLSMPQLHLPEGLGTLAGLCGGNP